MQIPWVVGRVLDREGGVFDHPDDPGRLTNHGITIRVFKEWTVGHNPEAEAWTVERWDRELRALTREGAAEIIDAMFYRRYGIHLVPKIMVQDALLDAVVLYGPKAIKWLQEVAGVEADGLIGPVTLAAIQKKDAMYLIAGIVRWRCLHAAGVVRHEPHKVRFLFGWIDRATKFLEFNTK